MYAIRSVNDETNAAIFNSLTNIFKENDLSSFAKMRLKVVPLTNELIASIWVLGKGDQRYDIKR